MNLQPGYRFYPTEEELINFYLHNKLEKTRDDLDRVIPVVDVYNLDPWQLTESTGELCRGELDQWFFFCPKQKREAGGGRPNRITPSGYWKATGSPGLVISSLNQVIGGKRTMVFYQGKAPSGRKTNWKMNEYRAIQEEATPSSAPPKLRNEFSLCRVYVNSGCLRAFDRRPLAEGTTEMIRTSKQKAASDIDLSDKKKMRSSTSSNHETPLIEEKTGSLDGSSSLGLSLHSHAEEPIDSDMNDDLDGMLEWFDLI